MRSDETPRGPWEEPSRNLATSSAYRTIREGASSVSPVPVPVAAWIGTLLARDLGRSVLAVVPHEADVIAWTQMATLLGAGADVVAFPTPALSPYQAGEPALSARARESVALSRLVEGSPAAVVVTPRALLLRLPDPAAFAARRARLRAGEELERERLEAILSAGGYRRVDLVAEVGDVAVRGGLVDVYPPGFSGPVRIDYFGDTVETIRRFAVEDQRSLAALPEVEIPPLAPFPVDRAAMRRAADRLEELGTREAGIAVAERIRELRSGSGFPGWERFAVLGADSLTLPELVPDAFVVAIETETLLEEATLAARRIGEDRQARAAAGELAPPPESLVAPVSEVESVVERADLRFGVLGPEAVELRSTTTDVLHGQLPRFPREVRTARRRGDRVLLVSPEGHHEQLAGLLERHDVTVGPDGLEVVDGELTRGFRLPAAGVSVWAEAQLFPRRPRRRAQRARYGPFVSSLQDLEVGDFVVHVDHGIGQFVGLRNVGGEGPDGDEVPETVRDESRRRSTSVEVMEIVYRDGRTLLLPLSRIEQIQRYSGIEGAPPTLDKLGGASWNRTKARVRKSVRKLAIDLVQLYAERQVAEAPAMEPDSDLERQFADAFTFDETEDQLEAIAAITENLERRQPMDRLLCGDVGFGKTEVAMRAAFKVVDSGYQVAVLAPTTILADQHLETFRRRFAGFPVRIEMISRFRSAAEIREIRRRVEAREIDILIGTHRLLSKDIEIPGLGLLVIDEEQRFGVAQKERLRELKKDLHVLAMSATPVPRTLQLSLAGVRDLSVIETPPRDRMAVETQILPFTPEVVREAIEFEIERGGQIYYVYNRVEDIERIAEYVGELVPGLQVTVGHGQMDEGELARRMHAFTDGEYDLLLATTIIENGIHIPRVNTMLVHRADRFGLAQLYQLRGRVGRSSELGYCYLLIPGDRVLSRVARKRLDALRDFSELGAGFRIAARDLEIRGAGNLLGAEQSGHIAAVGIETYLKLLEETIREIRGDEVEEAPPSVTLDLPVPMSIPESYVSSPNVRMELYRRIADAEDDREILEELADRFGPPPEEVRQLVALVRVKRMAEGLRIQSLAHRDGELVVRLRRDAKIDPERLVSFVAETEEARFSPDGVLSVPVSGGRSLVAATRETLERLTS